MTLVAIFKELGVTGCVNSDVPFEVLFELFVEMFIVALKMASRNEDVFVMFVILSSALSGVRRKISDNKHGN